ncbi:pre-mRNA-splicing factor syf1 [Malassezia equina]|uniref:Pre-mRNA-splicing factor SYF1 n=1 Tax=Malassezia equina TaxID=1381935 RepID=A0AAF0EEY8_9BASI|nr:pre-mRNA-splicing factor syf1 [Malassezia equina]
MAGSRAAELERVSSLLQLTFPIPGPNTHPNLIPHDDLVLEQELLRNPDNMRTWTSYITHVEEVNYRKRPIPDTWMSSGSVKLLGLLSDETQRLALQRIVGLYERAVAVFPTSYKLWHRYLNARARFVTGHPRDGEEGHRHRYLHASHGLIETGPELLEERGREEKQEVWDFALDGTIGWKEWRSLAATYERALLCLPMMTRIWLDYLSLFVHPNCSPILARTHARRTFDRALRTLPASQHPRIWKLYLRWAELCGGELARRVWRRYLYVDASLSEAFAQLLVNQSEEPRFADGHQMSMTQAKESQMEDNDDEEDEDEDELSLVVQQRILEASKMYLKLARESYQGSYTSPEGKSPYQMILQWLELAERFPEVIGLTLEEERKLPARDPEAPAPVQETDLLDLTRLPVAQITHADGLAHFPDQAGRLWSGLATYYIKRGDFQTAQDTFEKGMETVLTVRDFTQIFDAYAGTSENVIQFMMEELEEEEAESEEKQAEQEAEIDRRMQEFETLMERRPFLVNDVMLRRNPDDVQEWAKRVVLWGGNDEKVIETYKKALETINPRKATANLHQLYIRFAQFYEMGGAKGRKDPGAVEHNVPSARQIFEKAVKVPYKRVDDLAEVWCSWAEMEIRNSNYNEALRVMSRATSTPSSYQKIRSVSYYDETIPPQSRLFKSLKLWAFYTELEEALGTMESAKKAFDRIMELKIANAQTIINFALFLEEQKYYEEAFKVYERGVELFTYPVAFELWNVYLSKFVKRYGGSRLERARDLFEQALDKCPPNLCKPLYLKYGQLEEDYGLVRKAMSIYERGASAVSEEDRFEMYTYYIAKATANYGLAATRPIYEAAIEVLPDRQAASMCLRFATLERKLGEIERARAIYAHASQFCNPKTQQEFWQIWNAFEIETGTEDTFRDMLRIKRSVQAQYNTDRANVASSIVAPQDAPVASDPMAMLEAQNRAEKAGTDKVDAPTFVAASHVSKPQVTSVNQEQVGDGNDDDLL